DHLMMEMGRRVRGDFALRYCALRYGKAAAKGISALQRRTSSGHLRPLRPDHWPRKGARAVLWDAGKPGLRHGRNSPGAPHGQSDCGTIERYRAVRRVFSRTYPCEAEAFALGTHL